MVPRAIAWLPLVLLLLAGGARPAAATPDPATIDGMASMMFSHLNTYWFTVFFGNDDIDYDLLVEYHLYENGSDWIPAHRCPAPIPEDNAVYCHFEQAIFIDRDLMEEASARYGPEVVALTMAHEWGHHIEWTLAPEAYLDSFGDQAQLIAFELLADCFAGASIRPLVANRTFDSAEIADMRAFVAEGGDDEVTGVPGALVSHGTAAMRLEQFDKGLAASSPAACFER